MLGKIQPPLLIITPYDLVHSSFSWNIWQPLGRKFDKNGDIVTEWWSDESLKQFNKRAKCIEKQYSKYKVQDKYPVS